MAEADWPELKGPIIAIAASGDYAYAAIDAGFQILDIREPGNWKVVSHYTANSGHTLDIAVSENIVFLLTDQIHIVDARNPDLPALLRIFTNSTAYPQRTITIYQGSAFLTGRRFEILDISDPANPVLQFTTEKPSYNCLVHDGFAYVNSQNTIDIYDLQNPTAPRKVAILRPGFGTPMGHSIAFHGNYAYTYGEGHIYDISDPTQPRQVGTFTDHAGPLWIENDRILFYQDGSLVVGEFGDTFQPTIRFKYDLNGVGGGNVAITGNRALLAGTLPVDINLAAPDSTPLRPKYLTIREILQEGDLVFAGTSEGVRILDASEAGLKEIGSFHAGHPIFSLALKDTILFASSSWGIYLIDVGDPTVPRIERIISDSRSVTIVETNLYTLGGDFKIFNIENPRHPVEIGALPISIGYHTKVFLNHTNAFFVSNNEFYIINVADRENPALVGSFPAGKRLTGGVEFYNGMLLITHLNGFFIYDISEISNPLLRKDVIITNGLSDVRASDIYKHSLALCGSRGIGIFNISDVEHPNLTWFDAFPASALFFDEAALFTIGLGTIRTYAEVQPTIRLNLRREEGNVELHLSKNDETAVRVTLERSVDLKSWTPMGTWSFERDPIRYVDTNSFDHAIYRIVQQ